MDRSDEYDVTGNYTLDDVTPNDIPPNDVTGNHYTLDDVTPNDVTLNLLSVTFTRGFTSGQLKIFQISSQGQFHNS